MENFPKVSVIVPVYNVEQYLRECLDSIISQTFADWECILVDDGSKDNSGRICDEYELKDNRFRVIHQQNAGVSTARNIGLDEAKCDWIAFIDSDDWIDNNYLELLYSTAVKTDSDMVVCGYVKEKKANRWDKKSKIVEENIRFDTKGTDVLIMSRDEFLGDFHIMRTGPIDGFLQSPCMRIYRVNKQFSVRFESEIKYGEDYLFNLEYYSRLQKISFLPDCTYHYRFVQSSANNKTIDEKLLDNVILYINATQAFFEKYLSKSVMNYFYVYKRCRLSKIINNAIKAVKFDNNDVSILNYAINIVKKETSNKLIFAKPLKIKEVIALVLNKINLTKIMYVPIVRFWVFIMKIRSVF